jgi:ATP-binding cassette, subfamily B, bacterial
VTRGRHADRGSTDAGAPRASPREFARRARIVVGLVWAASPLCAVLMLVLAFSGGSIPTLTAWLQREVLNDLVSRGPATGTHARAAALALHPAAAGHVLLLAGILGGAGVVSAITQYGQTFIQSELDRGLSVLIKDRMFQAMNSFPGLSRFESPVFADKVQVAQQLSNSTTSTLVSGVLQAAQSLVTTIGMFGALELINPVLAGIVAFSAVPAIAAQISNGRRRARLEWQRSPAVRRQLFYGRLLSDRDGAKEVRLFGLGNFLRGRMLSELRSVNAGQRVLDLRILVIEGSLSLLTATITAGGTVWVVREVAAGRMSVGDVSLFAMAAVGVQGALSGMVSRLSGVYRSLLLFGHYVDIVTMGPDLSLAASPRRLPALRHGVEVRDVWFRYDDQHPWVLRGVSMFVPFGHSVALIGLNGAGKSTLVKLICRLYDPARGSILWDGTDISEVAPEDLRARIGTVFQDYMTYDLTAAENVGVGDLDRLNDMERIREAAAQAGVHNKIASLPRGYQTLLSRIFFSSKDNDNPETGVILSGGQWQRLAVARGLMRSDRDLLILDEPSSGMDAEAEHALHRRLCAIRAGKTSLLISHRLGSVRDADEIYVLSGGQIAESGTHATLMAAQGEYHRLFTLQASGYQVGNENGNAAPGSPNGAAARGDGRAGGGPVLLENDSR